MSCAATITETAGSSELEEHSTPSEQTPPASTSVTYRSLQNDGENILLGQARPNASPIDTVIDLNDPQMIIEIDQSVSYTIADNVVVETIDMTEQNSTQKKNRKSAKGKLSKHKAEATSTHRPLDIASNNRSDKNLGNDHSKNKKSNKRSPEQIAVNPLDNWEEEDKHKLLNLFKTVGVYNLEKVASSMPDKSLEEIQAIAHYFRRIAEQEIAFTAHEFSTRRAKRQKRTLREGIPLTDWQLKLNETYTSKELHTVTSDAFRLIAECEEFPSPSETSYVDFKQLYNLIADAMDGLPLSEVSNESYEVLRRVFTDISLTIQHHGRSGFDQYMKNINDRNYFLMNLLSNEDKNCPLRVRIFKLMQKKGYNPLGIPMNLLDTRQLQL